MSLTIGERFQDARLVHNCHGRQSVKEVSNALSERGHIIHPSLIHDLEKDTSGSGKDGRDVGYKSILILAKYYNVSVDYLLGLSDEPTTDTNMAAVCKYTGLSEKSVWALHYLKTVGYTTKADDIGHIINILLENTWSAYNLKSNCTHRTILSSLGLFFEIESKGNPAVTINQEGEICPDSGNLLFSPTQIKLNDRIIENALLMEISQALVELKETMKEGENNG